MDGTLHNEPECKHALWLGLTLLGVNFFGFTKSREWIFFLKIAEN